MTTSTTDRSAAGREEVSCDVLILGAGPAGLTAALYAARSRLNTVVLEKAIAGGQVATTFHIENYPGVGGVINGLDLVDAMKRQALSFGAVIHDMQPIVAVEAQGPVKRVLTDKKEYVAKALIVATGAEPRKLPVEGEKAYRSRGIHYCATCDGAMYQGAEVLVVGGGISALEEAEFLTRFASHVTIINRSNRFRASDGIVRHVLGLPGISVKYRTQVVAVSGDVMVDAATLRNLDTEEEEVFAAEGIFVYIGSIPDTSLFGDTLALSPGGFILAGEDMRTNLPGVFVAGDIREKVTRQITTAVADGTVAAVMAERFLAEST